MAWETDGGNQDSGAPRGLERIVGMAGVVSRLTSIVVTPALGVWSGVPGHRLPGPVLLHGPSGGGKRCLADAVAESLDVPLLPIDVCELIYGTVVSSPRAPRGLRRVEVCVDELVERGGGRRCVVWLSGLDRLVELGVPPQHRLAAVLDEWRRRSVDSLVLAGTTVPWALDQELLAEGRFERFVHVPPPDWHARCRRITERAARRRIDLGDMIDQVAAATAGWSGDEIDRLVDEIALLTVGASSVVVAPVVSAALAASESATPAWRRHALEVLAVHDEQGGFDDLVPHLDLGC